MTIPVTESPKDLSQKTLKGILWSYGTFIGGKGLTFVSTIILARLLLPEQFGLVGYCLVAIQYLDILNSAGIDSALIARREKLEEAANAAFVANILLGILSFGLTWFLAPTVASFFKEDAIVPLLRLLGLSLPISGIGMVPDALLQRQLRFRIRLMPAISRSLMKGIVSIILAALGMGVWSLVWGQIVGILTSTLLAWVLAGWKPTWRFDSKATRAVTGYGFHIVMLEIVGALRGNVDYLLIGRILGAAALGYYTMAFRIPELLIRSVNHAIGRVSLPALAITQSDPIKLRSFYFNYLRYLSIFVFPVGIGLTLTAPLFIPIFLSKQWNAAIVPTMLISLALAISALGYVPGVLYKAVSKPDVLNRLAIAKLPIAIFILWYSTRWGINGVAAGQVAMSIISLSVDSLIANYIMQYPLKELIKTILPAFYATLIMAFVLLLVYQILPLGVIFKLVVMVLAGILVYVSSLWLINRESLLQGFNMFSKTFLKSKVLKPASLEAISND
jgi:O-antigen/teichoic acid export membrane protein